MAHCIYVTGTEAQSGKGLMVLGLMEWLWNQGRKVGCFRPVILSEDQPDRFMELVKIRSGSRFPYVASYGSTYKEVIDAVADDRREVIFKSILDKYKAVEEQCDVVVIVGSYFPASAAPLGFGFNAEMAYNLGCPVLPIVKGLDLTVSQIVDSVRVVLESLERQKCDVLAVIVNRVKPELVRETLQELHMGITAELPHYVLPEHAVLAKPTVGELAKALQAHFLHGDDEGMSRMITNSKVAAMELPHFLDRVEEGNLIIAPGDRSDIILGCLVVDASANYPSIAGLLLTGGFQPAPQIQRLIEGLGRSRVPLLSVDTDTYTTATNVNEVKSTLTPDDSRKMAAALGIVEANVHFEEVLRRLAATRPPGVTPLMFEYELIQRAKSKKQHIVLPEGTEERILRAAEILMLRDVVDITLLGDQDRIRQRISALGLALDGVNIVDPLQSPMRDLYAQTYHELRKAKGVSYELALDVAADPSYFGTLMVYHGHADGMVSGSVNTTSHTIRPAFEIIRTRPGSSIVSSVFFMCLSDRVLVFGDCAVNPDPKPEQLADIAISSAETAMQFGIEPYVAMLSYSTGESGSGADVDKVKQATELARNVRPDLKIEGPIQYDAAIDAGVARTKLPGSLVAGHATVFIFPDLNAGNTTYKAVQRSANAVAVGPVLQGLRRPVNDLSRGCTVTDIVNTVAITAIQAQGIEDLQ